MAISPTLHRSQSLNDATKVQRTAKQEPLRQSMTGVHNQPTMHQCSENGVVSVYVNPGQGTVTKVIHLEEVRPEYGERLSQEAVVLRGLRHVNIVAYLSHTVSPSGVLRLVMEYVPGHDLFDFLLLHGPPNVPTLCNIVSQLLGGLKYLHARHIAHGDIKLENVMITDWTQVKLIDFGYAVQCEPDMDDFSNVMALVGMGTLGYTAPEVRMGDVCHYNPLAADVYSVSVAMGVLLCGQFDETSAGLFNPENALNTAPSWLSGLLRRGLTMTPWQRPSMAQLLAGFTRQSGKHSI